MPTPPSGPDGDAKPAEPETPAAAPSAPEAPGGETAAPPTPHSPPSETPAYALGGALLLLGAVAIAYAHLRAPPPTALAPPTTDPVAPKAPAPMALEAYRAAFAAWRSGELDQEVRLLGEAVRIDPTFHAARMRLAIGAMLAGRALPGDVRTHATAALQSLSALTSRDQLILEAFEPALTRAPADVREAARRTSALAEAHRDDSEVAVLSGMAAHRAARLADAEAAFRHALELSPSLTIARVELADVLVELGRGEEAARMLETCIDGADAGVEGVSPACRAHRMARERALGQCEAMATDARALLVWETSNASAFDDGGAPHAPRVGGIAALLAEAQARAALDAPMDELERIAARARNEGAPPQSNALFEAPLLTLAGKLDEARASAERRAAATPPADIVGRAATARVVIDLALETGDLAGAGKLAASARAELGGGDGIPDVVADLRPRFAAIEVRAGRLGRDERQKLEDTWDAAWRARSDDDAGPWVSWRRWAIVRASGVETADDAKAALALAPAGSPGAAFDADPLTLQRAYGHTLLRAGRAEDALPYLRRAAAVCSWSLPQVLSATLDLGDALAQQGDKKGACASYAVVAKRWRDAKPASRTAEAARAAAGKLGCAR